MKRNNKKGKKYPSLKDAVADPTNLKQFMKDAKKLQKRIGTNAYVVYLGGKRVAEGENYGGASAALKRVKSATPLSKADIFQVSVGLTN